ncbi:helix-turn-helix domain-containing protein [Streptomyces noursei]|nr:helix-turn-helix domain-containing protein [Streptomyces noursei]UWS75499.1 helix-turn-helix domain-containing protein [Streptomyces noursei]
MSHAGVGEPVCWKAKLPHGARQHGEKRMTKRVVFSNASFGSSLRLLREERGLSLGDLSRLVNYSRSHLSRVETGKKQPAEGLVRLCDDALDAKGSLLALLVRAPRRQSGRSCPIQLPRSISDFTGREGALDELDALLSEVHRQNDGQAVVTVVEGAAGVGKTATVVHWGHGVRSHFPDGVLFADLQGFGPGGRPVSTRQVLRNFMTALGAEPVEFSGEIHHLAASYRSLLTGRRLLIVLDNAATAEQVRPLLPASPRCMTVITSRSRLTGLVTRDGSHRITVPPLTASECDALLSRLGVASRPPKGASPCACQYLPLTVRIAAERRETVGGMDICERCGSDALLTYLYSTGDDVSNMYTALSWSYRYLPPAVARAFRVLAAEVRDTVTVSAAARLLGVEVMGARKMLESLADIHLLQCLSSDEYRFEKTVRGFARELDGRDVARFARAGHDAERVMSY